MTPAPRPRAHLVERAVEALAGAAELLPPASPQQPPPPQQPGVAPDGPAIAAAAKGSHTPAVPPRPPIALEVMRRAGLVAAPADAMRSRAAEEVRVVQTQVLRTLRATPDDPERCGRVVLVTSARPGEGKTFTSLNLAASIAEGGGACVVLVDADGKRDGLSRLLGCEKEAGLATLAADPRANPAPLLCPTAIAGLSVLPCGAASGDGVASPHGVPLATAILRLARALPDHVIILDTSPCLSTSDPTALAAIAGQAVVVVHAELTQRSEVEAALDMIDACPSLQLLLNQTRHVASDSFGAYGYGAKGPYGSDAQR
jgi:receptor protein-tyrosine kinase